MGLGRCLDLIRYKLRLMPRDDEEIGRLKDQLRLLEERAQRWQRHKWLVLCGVGAGAIFAVTGFVNRASEVGLVGAALGAIVALCLCVFYRHRERKHRGQIVSSRRLRELLERG